jgi:predicted phosphoribosyltransferase
MKISLFFPGSVIYFYKKQNMANKSVSHCHFRNYYVVPGAEFRSMSDILENPLLHNRKYVFSDRHDAGKQLGVLVRTLPSVRGSVVLAIPAGGVPVGRELAAALDSPLSLAIVRKIQIPGNPEAGFGAVSWDGQVLINEGLRAALGLSDADVETAIERTKKNVHERIAMFTHGRALPVMTGKSVILADDGLASGFTMMAAVKSVRNCSPSRIIVAVPTASATSAELVLRYVDQVVCLNIRTSRQFAVADAYRQWYDLDDREVVNELTTTEL